MVTPQTRWQQSSASTQNQAGGTPTRLDTLKGLDVEQEEATSEPESATFESYYEVLQVDEDNFPDEDTVGRAEGLSKKPTQTGSGCLTRPLRKIYGWKWCTSFWSWRNWWTGWRWTRLALTAQLQLKYPALKTADDVLAMVKEHIPKKAKKRIEHAVSAARQKFEDENTFTPVHGMLLVDFSNVLDSLNCFAEALPPSFSRGFISLDGFLGESYGEERTPEYVLPDPISSVIVFILQQLPLLYNVLADKNIATGRGYGRGGLANSFLTYMEEFFESHVATIPQVFACICWIKSVTALQGDDGLSRNMSLVFKHSARLMQIMDASMPLESHGFARHLKMVLENQVEVISQPATGWAHDAGQRFSVLAPRE
ncbi:hypothetical protein PHYPSEUDO_008008 [Phytophthora pseudosyringae]|uniref:Uncharacterized protein n=1 Tax=Phytophthora pseudosyringae TaxID=221518 RepID=A0A8T1VID7_9STRA|nr:hypothetical protein PHYPSEUDO_008008 [Phytophthora pseudosyringae]